MGGAGNEFELFLGYLPKMTPHKHVSSSAIMIFHQDIMQTQDFHTEKNGNFKDVS